MIAGTFLETMATADLINLCLLVVTTVGLSGIVYQISESRSAQNREFARLRLENTFRYYDELRDPMRKNHMRTMNFVEKLAGGKKREKFAPLSDEQVNFLMAEGNEEERQVVIDSLAKLERLAVGIDCGLFDEDSVYKLSRSNISGQLGFYSAYIAKVRAHTPNAYEAFENLAERLHLRAVSNREDPSKQYQAALEMGQLPLSK